MHVKALVQTHVDLVQAASISVSSYGLRSCSFRGSWFLGVLSPLWLLNSFCFFYRVPWAWWVGFCRGILFRAEHSKVFFPLHIVCLWISVFAPFFFFFAKMKLKNHFIEPVFKMVDDLSFKCHIYVGQLDTYF